jgi:Uncharacterized conserved protein (DUF2358)
VVSYRFAYQNLYLPERLVVLWCLCALLFVRPDKHQNCMMQGVRIFGRLFFTRCRLDVRRIWQPESNRISMRWQFHGVPRIPWEVEGIFEGVSQFKLDRFVFFTGCQALLLFLSGVVL